jgi:DNA-directed RNA polymerase specialized sigma24 family protein
VLQAAQIDVLQRAGEYAEELSNAETAQVLGIGKTAACNRYFRALKRLKEILSSMPGFLDP